jgi:GH24 family phage-related lysozyme (muramidase)
MLNLQIIKDFEGLRLEAYLCPAGMPTIGYGSTRYLDGSKVNLGDKLTSPEVAERLLEKTINTSFLPILRSTIPVWNKLNINQQSALLSFAYNLGASFYNKPDFKSITRLINTPTTWCVAPEVHRIFKLYSKAGGKILDGLVRRRSAEAALFLTPPSPDVFVRKLTSVRTTYLKKTPLKQAKELEATDKHLVPPEFTYYSKTFYPTDHDNYYFCELEYGCGTWYLYKPDWHIV